jgi:hypothetical protein
LYPETVEVLATHANVAECDTGAIAAPSREIVRVVGVALLVMVMLPARVPVLEGAKVTFNVAPCPAVNI